MPIMPIRFAIAWCLAFGDLIQALTTDRAYPGQLELF
jgi:hypothetical protein